MSKRLLASYTVLLSFYKNCGFELALWYSSQGSFILSLLDMGITEFLATYITSFMQHTGYITVFVGMVMESMIFPVPSEAIMPFAGFLIATKVFSLTRVIIISTLGSIVGSLISYAIGYYGGKPFIRKFGKYFLLNEEELAWTETFFHKRGSITILISRFIPVVRHLISLPAGLGKMNLTKFVVYTIIGAGLRNTFLALVGKYLKENWELVMQYSKYVDIVVLAILGGIVVRFVYHQIARRVKNRRKG